MTEPLNVSRETLEALEHYGTLLRKWNARINLVSKSSIEELWNRHILDSAQVYGLAPRSGAWVDIGSGGGFPGLVVAAIAKELEPTRAFTLIESDVRKCAFLRTVSQELRLNVTILAKRVEDVPAVGAQVMSARALADLSALLVFCDLHLAEQGTALFLKGATWEKEVEAARTMWSFDLQAHKSKTHSEAAVLELKDIKRV